MIEDKFNLNSVSLTGDEDPRHSLYTFEGQEYKKAVAPGEIDFVDIGQRERRQLLSYDIDKYYRDTLNAPSGQPGKEKKKLKGWRALCGGGYDHQFFDIAKLDALEAKENLWTAYVAAPNQEEHLKQLGLEKAPATFTKKDMTTKAQLMQSGFGNWSKKDFFLFIRQCETFGRADYPRIASGFFNKSPEEVQRYSTTFWKKYHLIENGQKYVERIEKGEQEIEKYSALVEAIDQKY